MPYDYEVYAIYETSGQLEDKKLHELIDSLNPDLRVSKNREFFKMSPEKAYRMLEAIAIISGSADKLQRIAPFLEKSKNRKHGNSGEPYTSRRPRKMINFQECGIPVGAELVFVDDDSIKVTVLDSRHVNYDGETTTLSPLAARLRGVSSIQGSSYFTYEGRKIVDIAEETQWKEDEDIEEGE